MPDFLVTYRLDRPEDGAVVAALLPTEVRWRRLEIDVTETGVDAFKAKTGQFRIDEDNQLVLGKRVFPPVGAINSHLDEITWPMLSLAGIDIALADLDLYDDVYDWRTRGHDRTPAEGDVRITWGPTTDHESGGTRGWTITTYDWTAVGWAEPDWVQRATADATDAASVVAAVAELVKGATR